MLRVAIADANQKASSDWEDQPSSVVSSWLQWEAEQSGISFCSLSDADLIFLCFAGSKDFLTSTRSFLKRHRIDPDPKRRQASPFVLAGGAVCQTPLLALAVADAVAIGEGYFLIRELFRRVLAEESLSQIRSWLREYPHALTRSQIVSFSRDSDRPWLFSKAIEPIASPDARIDWKIPPLRSDDKVVRLLAAKGCPRRCLFCSTGWGQDFQQHPDSEALIHRANLLSQKGERVQLITNDIALLPNLSDIQFSLDSQSLSLAAFQKGVVADSLRKHPPRILRFGVEGCSSRIRKAIRKPIESEDLIRLSLSLSEYRINGHWFLISGLPFETSEDRNELRRTLLDLVGKISFGIFRFKVTSFEPNPPAPLARFFTNFEQGWQEIKDWQAHNAASRHSLFVWPRKFAQVKKDTAEILAVHPGNLPDLAAGETYDLAPTPEDMHRLSHNLIRWPISPEEQWEFAENYKKNLIYA